MTEYHKIETLYKRDPENNNKTLIEGQFALPEFKYLAKNDWLFTEKVDGTNIRVHCAEQVTFAGRTDKSQIPAKLAAKLEAIFQPIAAKVTEMLPEATVLYGEGYGAGIQKGGENYAPEPEFVVFDIRMGPFWMPRNDVAEICARLGLQMTPIVGVGPLAEMVTMVRDGFTSRWGDFPAEGIVARPYHAELYTRLHQRVITKLKHKDFHG